MTGRRALVALAVLALAGCHTNTAPSGPPTAPTPVESPQPSPAPVAVDGGSPVPVRAGTFCSLAGATGTTTAGASMVCATAPGDDRLRWRKGPTVPP